MKTPNVMLYIRVAGNTDSGNILIVINGGPGSASHDMMGLDPLASETLALVSYDQRGTGRSTAPTNGYALSEYIKDLDAVRQYFGVQKVHLFGHSWGGLIALAYAAAHQGNVASVSLLGSLGPTYGGWLAAQERFIQKVAKLQARGFIPKPIPSGLAGLGAIMPAYFSDPKFPIPIEVIKSGMDLEVQKATWQALGKWDLTNDFGKIATSVLVLWGEDDPFGVESGKETVSALSAAKTEFVVLKKMRSFLARMPGRFFYQDETICRSTLMVVDVKTDLSFEWETPKVLFRSQYPSAGLDEGHKYSVDPNGQRFLMINDITAIGGATSQISIVLNFFEDLKQKVSVD